MRQGKRELAVMRVLVAWKEMTMMMRMRWMSRGLVLMIGQLSPARKRDV